jgi:hypothetical protein
MEEGTVGSAKLEETTTGNGTGKGTPEAHTELRGSGPHPQQGIVLLLTKGGLCSSYGRRKLLFQKASPLAQAHQGVLVMISK